MALTMRNPSDAALRALLRQAQRALARSDPATFIEYVFGYELADHHRRMLDFAKTLIDERKAGVILCPRGAGKTTILNTGLMSFEVGTRPDIRVGLFSQKAEKAEAMSAAIMGVIDGSDEFREIFGNIHGAYKWTASEWLRKDSPHFKSKDRTMVTGGADQSSSAVSKRFDIQLLDDILDENNTYNIDRREKIETWFWKTLKPTQAAEGAATIVIGTRWTEGDLYQKLIEENKWPALVIPAIYTDEKTGEDRSYWPEVWPLDRLYKEREDVGWDNFACSYLNDVAGLREGIIFKKDWFDYFDELPVDRTFVRTMGVDLASSEKQRADYTARVIVAEDNLHEHWVLGTAQIKTDSGHRAFVEQGYVAYPGISKVIIETNQHQATFVQDLLRETNLPAVGRRTDTDKRTRARAAAARYESHRIHHHRSLRGGELETQLLGFPKGHDDLVDALGLALDLNTASGSFAYVSGAPEPSYALSRPFEPKLGREVEFVDGQRLVPEHVASMLMGIETSQMTYDQALAAANRKRLSDYVRSSLASVIPRG